MDAQTQDPVSAPDVPQDDSNAPPTKRAKKRKRPGAVEIGVEDMLQPAPPEEFTCTPWLDELGMTEYESKEQRYGIQPKMVDTMLIKI